MKSKERNQALKLLNEIEQLHVTKKIQGRLIPSEVDHAPYEWMHEADNDAECPVCKSLNKLKEIRALVEADA